MTMPTTTDRPPGRKTDQWRTELAERKRAGRGDYLAARRAAVLAPDALRAALLSPAGLEAVRKLVRSVHRAQDGLPRKADVAAALETLLADKK
jgi:hypothetical protein